MTIRSKLIFVYGATLVIFVGTGLAYYWAIDHWQTAAGELTSIYAQDTRAEQLRSAILRQTNHALDFLAGTTAAEAEVRRLSEPAAAWLVEGVRALLDAPPAQAEPLTILAGVAAVLAD